MTSLAEAKKRFKKLAEYIVAVDNDNKIVFLEYEVFCTKLKESDSISKGQVTPWLIYLLENNLITALQIHDILNIVENNLSRLTKGIKDLIIRFDEFGKFVLLPRKEFYKKFAAEKDDEVLAYKIHKLRKLFDNNLVSNIYIEKEWQSKKLLRDFFAEELSIINKKAEFIWEKNIKDVALSDKPIQEKIDYLAELRADLLHLQLHKDLGHKQKIDYLNIRIEELELKQRYEQDKQVITDSDISVDYSDNSKAERIIFLHELGILEYLKEKMNNELHYFAPNKLAEIISSFTDIPQATAQSYLNPIFTNGVNQNNNPLTEKNLQKVKKKLLSIGLDKSETT